MFTLTFIAIQIAELLKCMLFHTGDLGSRLDTLDDIDTEKNCPYPQIASLLLNSYHLKLGVPNNDTINEYERSDP